MQIDAKASREFQAAIFAVRALDKTLQRMIRQHVKAVAAPEWSKALDRRASTALDRKVIAGTATVAVSNQNVKVKAASKGRPLSGGLNPKTDYPGVEFGAKDDLATYRTRSRKGKSYTVTRHTARQLPRRNPRGRVFYPAAREMIPRIGSLLVQTIVKTIANAIEGKQE
ncbi:hypothetical protein [Microbacterium candidum]|uniref:HK97 gp10 family phage protein n=1 Tax=Microbacterium candidum TaxID=3041922 RepID=A0ABT7MWL4_9MICO|nr:hypothetical protein [Microbacterium sp. ASV49]MDL9978849.1 hypothetical protein [Microbacterium sp. ASV49]